MPKHSICWLKRHGFDGLVAPCGECGCDLEDHAPGIDCEPSECRPGYKVPCAYPDCSEKHDYHISVTKPRKPWSDVDPLKTYIP